MIPERIEDPSKLNHEVILLVFLDSSMVEHAAVNRGVVGSSPTRGADRKPVNVRVCRLFCVQWMRLKGNKKRSLREECIGCLRQVRLLQQFL